MLRYRAMALGVPVPQLHGANGRSYWPRFGTDHVDLCDLLSSFGASAKPSLAEVTALVGVPAKSGGVDGSLVEGLVAEGRLAEVAAYCETDVVSLYLVWLRWQLASGSLGTDACATSEQQCRSWIAARATVRPHLAGYAS